MDLTGPCNWPTPGCPACDGVDCLTGSQRADLEAWAISDLWEATGRVYGTCDVSVLPCRDGCFSCASCWGGSCHHLTAAEIILPGPVYAVTEVAIDGVTLDETDYRVDRTDYLGYILVRLDGGTWPSNTDPTDPDGFRVDYQLGVPPPAGAASAAGMLVCSRAGCANSGCKVPRNATQVSRQGVTMILSTGEAQSFGIPDVDAWVRNANAPMHAGAVHSPDLPSVREITWEAIP